MKICCPTARDFVYNCECTWRAETGTCQASYGPNDIGTCFLQELGDPSDNCDDGFLSYSWAADWEWSSGNYVFEDPLSVDYWENNTANPIVWHYNPLNPFLSANKSSQCVEGSNTIACPAQIQLPFFNWNNVAVTIIVIALIYFLINSNSKKKSAKKGKVRKKK